MIPSRAAILAAADQNAAGTRDELLRMAHRYGHLGATDATRMMAAALADGPTTRAGLAAGLALFAVTEARRVTEATLAAEAARVAVLLTRASVASHLGNTDPMRRHQVVHPWRPEETALTLELGSRASTALLYGGPGHP